jgi:hypothetical protein
VSNQALASKWRYRLTNTMLTQHRSVFKDSEDRDGLKCHEMNVCELEPAAEGKGIAGLWVVKSTVWMDVSKFMNRKS